MDKIIKHPPINISWKDIEGNLYSLLYKKLGWFHESVEIFEGFHLIPISYEINELTNTNTPKLAYYIYARGKRSGKVYCFDLWSLLDRKKFEVDGNKA